MGVVPKKHGGGASGRAGEAEWNCNGKDNSSWPVHPVLPGTIPPTQECTGKDLWLQIHREQRIDLFDINGRGGP